MVLVSELTNFIKSNGDFPRLTLRLSVFKRAMANRLLHVSPFHRTPWFSFRAVQYRNKVWNATKGRAHTLMIPQDPWEGPEKRGNEDTIFPPGSRPPEPSHTSSSKATHERPDPMHLPSCFRRTLKRRSRLSMARTVDGFFSR